MTRPDVTMRVLEKRVFVRNNTDTDGVKVTLKGVDAPTITCSLRGDEEKEVAQITSNTDFTVRALDGRYLFAANPGKKACTVCVGGESHHIDRALRANEEAQILEVTYQIPSPPEPVRQRRDH